jgi:ferritin-like metal-binding protein YciE
MGLFTSETFNSLDELLLNQMKDMYDAEHRIADALSDMHAKASNQQLKSGFEKHLAETKTQIGRLEQAFDSIGKSAERETCQATVGLIKEGKEVLDGKGDADVIDAALIANAQRIEHYEIAGYGTIRALAKRAGQHRVAELAQQSLDEEGSQDQHLTQLAESAVNPAAATA